MVMVIVAAVVAFGAVVAVVAVAVDVVVVVVFVVVVAFVVVAVVVVAVVIVVVVVWPLFTVRSGLLVRLCFLPFFPPPLFSVLFFFDPNLVNLFFTSKVPFESPVVRNKCIHPFICLSVCCSFLPISPSPLLR